MDDTDKQRLRKNRVALVKDIEPSRIIDHLIAADVFDPAMAEEITSQSTRQDKVGKLLNMLEKRGHHAYRPFRRCLLETNYKHLVELLDSTHIDAVDEVDARPDNLQVRGNPPNAQVLGGPNMNGPKQVFNINGDNNFSIIGGNNVTFNNYRY